MSDEGDDRAGDEQQSSSRPNPTASFVEDLLADAEVLADEYRERGWDVVFLKPGDISPAKKPDRYGFSVLLPDSEYEAVEEAVSQEEATFDEAEIYRRTVVDSIFMVAVELDESTETAVVVPLYYSPERFEDILETGVDDGEIKIHVRPLSVDQWVTFVHDDPTLFLPDEDEPDAADGSDDDTDN